MQCGPRVARPQPKLFFVAFVAFVAFVIPPGKWRTLSARSGSGDAKQG